MAKSYVLRALRIFGLEEMLKLSQSALVKPVLMKKAAGEDLVVWDDASETAGQIKAQEENLATVLPFKKNLADFTKIQETEIDPSKVTPQESTPNLHSSEYMLWNREMTKESGVPVLKKDAVKEYARSAEMYVVKTATVEGKEKIRFASTNGVLVDKKQA